MSDTLYETESLCPECLRVVPARLVRTAEGSVEIVKKCPEHGEFREVVWSDAEFLERALEYEFEGPGVENPQTDSESGCPLDCGLCPYHESTTALGIIDVTNRCNLNCPVCFANAEAKGYVYEPSLEQIEDMLDLLRSERPVPTPAVQFAGGEPLVREDIVEIVAAADERGFHVQIATNGVEFARNPELAEDLHAAGLNVVYLQFDGLNPKIYEEIRGSRKILELKKEAIKALEREGVSTVLVPTLTRGVNDDQIRPMLDFAREFEVIRGINVQPISFTGRTPREERERMRITISDFVKLVEKQTDGRIPAESFYPVPIAAKIARLIGQLHGEWKPEFSAHPICGVATYLLDEGDWYRPVTDYIDPDAFIDALEEVAKRTETLDRKRDRAKAAWIATKHLRRVFKGFTGKRKLARLVLDVVTRGTYDALADFHWNALLLGCMHFMDPYNFQTDRVRRCVIHYATPDGRIIPFCAYNSVHREEIERKFGVPLEEWKERRNG
ncbi:tetraether lipid synthase Tes [Methanopyrus sp.]